MNWIKNWLCISFLMTSTSFAGDLVREFGTNIVEVEVARLSTSGDVLQWVRTRTGADDEGGMGATIALNVGTPDKPEYQIVTLSTSTVKNQKVIHFWVQDTRVTLKSEEREELPYLYMVTAPVTESGKYKLYESWDEQLQVTIKKKPNM